MEEILCENAIKKDSNSSVVGAAHGKLCTQVIIGSNSGQTLHGADGIANDNFGEILQFGLVERLFRGCICFGNGVGFRGHRHLFRQSSGLLIQGNHDFSGISLFHCNRLFD